MKNEPFLLSYGEVNPLLDNLKKISIARTGDQALILLGEPIFGDASREDQNVPDWFTSNIGSSGKLTKRQQDFYISLARLYELENTSLQRLEFFGILYLLAGNAVFKSPGNKDYRINLLKANLRNAINHAYITDKRSAKDWYKEILESLEVRNTDRR